MERRLIVIHEKDNVGVLLESALKGDICTQYIGIIPTVFCANRVAELIASQVEGAVCMPHPLGCSQVGEDLEITARTLIAIGNHPNLAAVLIVGLGCERFTSGEFYESLVPSGKPAEAVVIRQEGDSLKTIEKGVKVVSIY